MKTYLIVLYRHVSGKLERKYLYLSSDTGIGQGIEQILHEQSSNGWKLDDVFVRL